MISIAAALLLLATAATAASYHATSANQLPVSETLAKYPHLPAKVSEVASHYTEEAAKVHENLVANHLPVGETHYEPIPDNQHLHEKVSEVPSHYPEEAVEVHDNFVREGRLPECVHELVFPCEVQKIYLDQFLDANNEQLTIEDLEQMNKDILEKADEHDQTEIYNNLDLLVEQYTDEVIAFGLNVLQGNVELAVETLRYAMQGESIWDVEAEVEADESHDYPPTFAPTAVHEETETTDAPVVTEEEPVSYLAPTTTPPHHHHPHFHGHKGDHVAKPARHTHASSPLKSGKRYHGKRKSHPKARSGKRHTGHYSAAPVPNPATPTRTSSPVTIGLPLPLQKTVYDAPLQATLASTAYAIKTEVTPLKPSALIVAETLQQTALPAERPESVPEKLVAVAPETATYVDTVAEPVSIDVAAYNKQP